MRWFFLILLMVNIVYVSWELNRERPHHRASPVLPPHVERIVLLGELETGAPEDDTRAPSADAAASLAQETRPLTTVEALPQQVQPGKAEPPPPPQPATVLATNSEAAAADQLAGEPPAVPEQEPAEEPAAVPVPQPVADLCYTLGPFREMKTLRVVTRQIKDYVVEASFRSRQEQEQSMFRVYLAPVGGKQEARALIKQLVSKNIRDYFIITDGPNKNGISLGFFSEKSRAERHAGRVRKLGFDAIIEPVFRSYTIYWLDYRIKAGHEIPQQVFDQHLDNTVQRLSRSCT